MRLQTVSIFALAGGYVLLTACTGAYTKPTDSGADAGDTDTDTDTDTDSDTDTDTNSGDSGTVVGDSGSGGGGDSGYPFTYDSGYGTSYGDSGYGGYGGDTATVVAFTSTVDAVVAKGLTGTQFLDITDYYSGTVYCEYAWNMSAASTDARSDCSDCTFAFDVTLSKGKTTVGTCAALGTIPADGAESVGFATSWSYGSTTYPDVAMKYDSTYGWYGFAYGTYDTKSGAFAYTYVYGYAYCSCSRREDLRGSLRRASSVFGRLFGFLTWIPCDQGLSGTGVPAPRFHRTRVGRPPRRH